MTTISGPAACLWAATLAAAAIGCGGSDVSSFGEGTGGAGGASASAGTESTTGASTTTGAGTGGSGQGTTVGTGSSGQGGDQGTSVGMGGAGQGGAGQGGAGTSSSSGEPSCGDDACEEPESCESCAEDCGECPDTCGNDACDTGETCATCEGDCGPCVRDCVEHTECSSDDICYEGECASAYGRTYVFTVVDGFFPVNNPALGTTWDPVGPPDPFVELCTQGGCPAATTTTKDDQSAPVWNESFSLTLAAPGDGDIWFLMWDEDFQVHDFALQTPLGSPAEWVDVVRTQGGTYVHEASPGLDLRIDVSPL